MGFRLPSAFTNTFIGPLPANANETIVFTTPLMILPYDGAVVFVAFSCDITAGTGVTRHIWVIRRGSLLSSPNTIALAADVTTQTAATRSQGSCCYMDINAGASQPIQYSLTVQQTGATGAGTFNDGCLLAWIL